MVGAEFGGSYFSMKEVVAPDEYEAMEAMLLSFSDVGDDHGQGFDHGHCSLCVSCRYRASSC